MTSLMMRSVAPARVGSEAWLATCRRLNLPEPPIDPNSPPVLGAWATVASWATSEPKSVVGLRGGVAWVHDSARGQVVGITAAGERDELPLF